MSDPRTHRCPYGPSDHAPDIADDIDSTPGFGGSSHLVPSKPLPDVADREELLEEANTPEAVEAREAFRAFQDLCDSEEAAPSAGLSVTATSSSPIPTAIR